MPTEEVACLRRAVEENRTDVKMAAGSALIRVRRREGKAHLLPQDSAMHKQDAYLSSRCNVREMHTTSGDDRLASCKILQDPACKAGSSLDRSRSMHTAPLPSYSGWLCIIHRCTSLKMKSGMYRRYPADAATFTGPHFFQTSGMSCRLDDLPLAGFILVHHPQGSTSSCFLRADAARQQHRCDERGPRRQFE